MNEESDALAAAIAVSLNVEREAAGWTLEALADELGLSEQTLGRYLTRRTRALPVDVLTRACAAIGIPIGDVISRAEQRLSNAEARAEKSVEEQAAQIAREARAARDSRDRAQDQPASSTVRHSKRGSRGSA